MRRRLAVLVFAIPVALFSQEFRATISGTINDPAGAVIPGAKVTVTETRTGTKIQTVSDSGGQYTAPFLLPGDYDIVAQMQGFKEFIRRGVHVGSGDHPVIDIRLDLGDTTQSVEVTANAALLNTENASTGQAITTKEVEELPVNGRTPVMLASLSLGVINTGSPGQVGPFTVGGAAGWSVGGSYVYSSALLINGSPNTDWAGRQAFSPPQDAVEELRVKAFDTDTAFGHTGGGTINLITKSGTNTLHGSLWEFNQPYNLTGNDFFQNMRGLPRQSTHYNQYGLTAGGPIFIPKVLDGRNKLFWFFSWENVKASAPAGLVLTVPTALERQGNFSQVLAADGAQSQLYDPYSAVLNGTTITRTAYPNNIIPTSQLNPIALNYLKYYGAPNSAPIKPDGTQNYASNVPGVDAFNNQLGRMDYNISPSNRIFFDVRHSFDASTKTNYFNNIATGAPAVMNIWGATVDHVIMVNPTNVVNLRLNLTRFLQAHTLFSLGFDPTALGFPSYIAANSVNLQMPAVSFTSNSGAGFTTLGNSGTLPDKVPSQSILLFGDWVTIKGPHTLKFGGDVRQYRLNTFTANNSTGAFSFDGNSWVRQSSASSATVAMGQDMASFLLGLPYSGSYDVNTFGSWYSYYFAGFVQDDWRVSRNLTVNMGLRYEWDGPYHEKYGRTVNGFDLTTPNPLAAAAQAAYAKSPIAQLPASAFNVLGGLTFASPSNNAVYQNTSHLVSPRFGFAWNPEKFHGKTVIRGGFGMFVSPVVPSTLPSDGSANAVAAINQQGFSQTTQMTVTNNNYLSPAATLSNPFPNGFAKAAGSSLGLLTYAGQGVSFLNPQMKSPYAVRWNIGIQQSLTPNLMLEVVYLGNHSVHLPITATQLNGLPRQFLSTLPIRDPNQTYLTGTVANPFAGLQTSQNTASTTAAQLLARYPQFPVGNNAAGWLGTGSVLEQDLNIGSSYFESLNVRLQKRLSKGLSVTFNYIYSKLTEKDSWLNASDPTPAKRVSPTDHPKRFVVASSYELPFGKGKTFANVQSRWANLLIAGWVLNGVILRQDGSPIVWSNGSGTTPGDYVYFGGPLNLNNRQINGAAFNTAPFATKTADAFNYHIRTFSQTFGNLHRDGINQVDASMLKRFSIAERKYFELRFEAFNAFNHPTFAAPNVTATNAAFGTITSVGNKPRSIQLGGRLVF